MTIFSMLAMYIRTVRDMLLTKNFYKPKTRTNIGKQSETLSVYSIAVDFWQELPCDFKILPNFSFNGKVKQSYFKIKIKIKNQK